MASTELRHVCKRFDKGVIAVNDLSLHIDDGSLLVLVGPSGCGKSTTLRLVAGLEDVTSGTILIGDRDVTDLAPAERDIAMVFQNYALYPHMTVRQNLAFGLKMRRTSGQVIRQRVTDAATMLEIGELLDRRPGQLSGGQRQRVALGRAIVRQPAVFLFDEPLSNLDAKLRGQTRMELSGLHRRLGATMIFVTHDQTEAMTLGQVVAVMEGGVLQQVGSPLELYRRPANRFVAGFLGSPPMNLIEGAVSDGKFVAGPLSVPLASIGNSGVGPVAGEKMTMGFRPEHVLIGAGSVSLGSVRTNQVERLGSTTLFYFRLGHTNCAGQLAGDIQPPGEWTPGLDRDNIHWFDGQGQRIGGGVSSRNLVSGS
jgi:ABC-type sugar transport system ATPase subunit